MFNDSRNEPCKPQSNIDSCSIAVNCLTAKWPSANKNENFNTLRDVTIAVGPSQLLAVVGHVGAGKVWTVCITDNRYKIAMTIDLFIKSSLLNAILGELEPSEGSCKVVGKVAYASQAPWIFSGTVRQNILCGLDYDAERYNRVIEACALIDDFNLFSDGDSTLMVNEALHSVAVKRHASIWLVLCTLTLTFIYSTILWAPSMPALVDICLTTPSNRFSLEKFVF